MRHITQTQGMVNTQDILVKNSSLSVLSILIHASKHIQSMLQETWTRSPHPHLQLHSSQPFLSSQSPQSLAHSYFPQSHTPPQQLQDFFTQNPHLLGMKYGPFQQTCLFYALKIEDKSRRLAVVNALVQMGADINARNKIGQTALFYAAAKLDQQSCKLLLQLGADPLLKDELQKTAVDYAQELGNHKNGEIMEFYMKAQGSKQGQQTMEDSAGERKTLKPTLTYAPCYISHTGKINHIVAQEMHRLLLNRPHVYTFMKHPKLLPKWQFDLTQNWRRVGLKIIDRLMTYNESSWFKHLSQIWRIQELGPDSPGVDLVLIRKKLEHQIYTNPKQLREDINNIWVNTKKRLGDLHETTKHALQLCTTFEHLAREYHYNAYID